MLCYVMWNLFAVDSLQFPNYSTIASLASLEANQSRLSYLSKNYKITLKKMQVSKPASSIRRSFASQDFYCNNNLNIPVQKQNES